MHVRESVGGARPTGERWTLELEIRLDENGPAVARERVRPEDLDEPTSELWREACLRRGLWDTPPESVVARVEPIAAPADLSRWCGYRLVLERGVPRSARGRALTFTVRSLDRVARRTVLRLVTSGVVRATDLYYYEIRARREPVAPPRGAERGDAPFDMTTSSRPLSPLELPIAPVRATSTVPMTGMRPAGATENPFPVFYTRAAHRRAERVARRGQWAHPPVETGGVLVGPVGACPETGELYAVVTDVIEAESADESERSLSYSARTWQRIQAVVRGVRSREGCASYRVLGQVHGHNFVPADGAPPCEHCASQAHCTRTSVFVSGADQAWSDAVFCRQPWTLCHIFGLNARHESVQALFGLDDGRLLPRPFHVIEAFDPRTGASAPERAEHQNPNE